MRGIFIRRRNFILFIVLAAASTYVIITNKIRTDERRHDGVLGTRNMLSQLSNKLFLKNYCPSKQQTSGLTQTLRRHTQRHACSSLGFYDDETHQLGNILGNISYLRNIYVSERYRIYLCLIPKAGSNNWVRALLTLEGVINSTNTMSPREISWAAKKHLRVLGQFRPNERIRILRNYTSVIFVRNPYTHLLSAFRDRLETYPNRNPTHRRIHNPKIHRKFGNHSPAEMPDPSTPGERYNVTFKEFVDYYLSGITDVHWREQYKVCPPCLDYDYIGKMESFSEDFDQAVKIFNASSKVSLITAAHATNSSKDAILRKYYETLSDLQMEQLGVLLSSDLSLFGYSIPGVIQRNKV
ncbi:carbohydrate sulfotransferase 9-like [Lytechinus pictus]|uniref:carbohydrate sulfotransferase 9-like n=1 Tax=Lytechinus pictus TaxID=7653 RepID=UPI0030BA2A35